MSKQTSSQILQTATENSTDAPSGILQRKCASCETHTIAGDKCDKCANKEGVLQRKSSDSSQYSEVPPVVNEVLQSSGQLLDSATRAFFEPRFGYDFSGVRVHSDERAAESAQAVNALAYTVGQNVVFGARQWQPQNPVGKELLAHELTHVVQQSRANSAPGTDISGASGEREADDAARAVASGKQVSPVAAKSSVPALQRKTPGETAMESAEKTWLTPDAQIKTEVDVLKAALREIKAEKNVSYNQKAGLGKIDAAAKILPLNAAETKALKDDWDWLANNRKSKSKADYKKREQKFFSDLKSPLTNLGAQYPKAQTKFWLKNTPPQVADIIIQAADADMPADQLYAYAAKEGLIDYIRAEMGIASNADPTPAQLTGVSTSKKIAGFDYLGTDDFLTDMDAKRFPHRSMLPAGFNLTKVTTEKRTNEKQREIDTPVFPNLLMAVQALAVMLKRRRKLFLEDAKANGYATPTTDELVYWTYVYFNVGEFGGKAQLEKYKGKRKLSDWITSGGGKGEYDNAIKLLQSYQMLTKMSAKKKIF
jgi:hypothetical protein